MAAEYFEPRIGEHRCELRRIKNVSDCRFVLFDGLVQELERTLGVSKAPVRRCDTSVPAGIRCLTHDECQGVLMLPGTLFSADVPGRPDRGTSPLHRLAECN